MSLRIPFWTFQITFKICASNDWVHALRYNVAIITHVVIEILCVASIHSTGDYRLPDCFIPDWQHKRIDESCCLQPSGFSFWRYDLQHVESADKNATCNFVFLRVLLSPATFFITDIQLPLPHHSCGVLTASRKVCPHTIQVQTSFGLISFCELFLCENLNKAKGLEVVLYVQSSSYHVSGEKNANEDQKF